MEKRPSESKFVLKQRSGTKNENYSFLASDLPIFVEFAQKKNLILDETESQLLWGISIYLSQ
jgi:hypothetical protein